MRDPLHMHCRGGGIARCCRHGIFPDPPARVAANRAFTRPFLSPDQRGGAVRKISLGSSSRPGTDSCLVCLCRFVVFEVRPVLYRDGDEPQIRRLISFVPGLLKTTKDEQTNHLPNQHSRMGWGRIFPLGSITAFSNTDFVEELSSPNLANSKCGSGEFPPNLGKTSKGGRL
jgi:hypothetical protein